MTVVEGQTMISDCLGIYNISNNPSGQYALSGDIDCTGANWTVFANPFSGSLDGKGKFISNLNFAGYNHASLLGQGNGANVTNLNLKNISISGGGLCYFGVLFGSCTACSISNVHVFGSSVNGYAFVGAIAGQIINSVLYNCSCESTSILGTASNHGGLFGCGTGINMTCCYNYGFGDSTTSILGGGYVGQGSGGGIGGYCIDCSIAKCGVHSGQILTALQSIGGLFGTLEDSSMSQVYVLSNVSVTGCQYGKFSPFFGKAKNSKIERKN